ncbi:hypothetical protein [Campylobacter gastrosuis]|uniref:Uncharacterized protein n=1 Tax=Campylobacter gastrosuis TaxID=2974576 RepID=A0ABT7HR38_9BACT|nr:hypothetical protein [Campylobacter gastrosuis]MDL0089382.1 hypothetical protein [Campylobacter gastrosuis]
MSKLDEAKERLLTLRFWLSIAVGSFLAIVGWIANNYKEAENILIISAFCSLALLIIAILIINRAIDKKSTDIGKLKK